MITIIKPFASQDLTSGPASDPRTIDLSYLEQIRGLCKPGGPDLVQTVLRIFLTHLPSNLESLDQCLKSDDIKQTSRAAHKLKSSSANIGALQLTKLLEQLEFFEATDEHSSRQELWERIQAECGKVRRTLEDLLANP